MDNEGGYWWHELWVVDDRVLKGDSTREILQEPDGSYRIPLTLLKDWLFPPSEIYNADRCGERARNLELVCRLEGVKCTSPF